MKKLVVIILVLSAFAFEFECYAQKLPIREYLKNDSVYTIESMKKFYLENTPISNQCERYLLSKTKEKDIESLFKNIIVIDTTLEAGVYKNSCWNVSDGLLDFFPGKKFTGKVAVYKKGKERIPLFKMKCGNVLDEAEKTELKEEDKPYKPDLKIDKDTTVVKKDRGQTGTNDSKTDTLVKKVHVEENYISRNNYYEDDVYFRPVPMTYSYLVWFPSLGRYHRCSNHAEYNLYIQHGYSGHKENQRPRREKGGPVGTPSYDVEGGPVGVPSHNVGSPSGSRGYNATSKSANIAANRGTSTSLRSNTRSSGVRSYSSNPSLKSVSNGRSSSPSYHRATTPSRSSASRSSSYGSRTGAYGRR